MKPETALNIFQDFLDSPDPAVRLFAGMGIMRISDWRIPFRLTARPKETDSARKEWLASRTLRRADDWAFPDPLIRPIIKEQRGGRIDLWWLNEDGSIARQKKDVWPRVRQVSYEGTFYSTVPTSRDHSLVVTASDGEVLMRMGQIDYSVGGDFLADHGGTWNLRQDTREAVELAPNGEVLWSCPTSETNTSARFVGSGGRGRILLLRHGKLEVLNRRGDVIWSIEEGMDDPRWVCMTGPETILVSCTNEIQIRHRTEGLLSRVGGFTSLGPVRYHPEEQWMIFDGGSQEVILYSPKTGARIPRYSGWRNWDPSVPSQWLEASER